MRLANRLRISSLAVIITLTVVVVGILDRQLRGQTERVQVDELAREARFVASQWSNSSSASAPGNVSADASAMALAHAAGGSLGHRVTLVRADGVVVGDSEFDSLGTAHLENHAQRPEIRAARSGLVGVSRRASPSKGDTELYVAVPGVVGVVRVSESTNAVDAIFDSTLRGVLWAGVIAAAAAFALAALFARSVSMPIIALRDVARAIAAGDLSQRPAISAPGEVGDLAIALYQVSEQLGARVNALRADEALLSAVIESVSDGVLAVSSKQTVLLINGAGRTMLRLRESTPFSADFLPRERALRNALSEALLGRGTTREEVDIGGQTLVIAARPLAGTGAVLTVADITATRKLETIRRDFVANVSHELRTPLTVIGGFAETLSDRSVGDADRAKFASLILSNTQRMQRLVDELLDLSRLESGAWAPHPADVDVASVAADTFASYADAARAHDVLLEAQIAPEARRVHADPTALRQILNNLVENAVRYTSHGTVTVFTQGDAEAGTSVIGVRDSGVGIAPAHVSRIFERFFRTDAARARENGGTGLGLAIVKHLVEAHGGRVWAESTLGSGTTISVQFPSLASDAPARS